MTDYLLTKSLIVPKYYFKMKTYLLFFFILSASTLSSCSQSDNTITPVSKAETYFGESKPFGGDSIRSWIKTDMNGNPISIGITFREAAFLKLETQPDSVFMLMLPSMPVGTTSSVIAPPFDHIEVDWVSKGDSIPPFNTPHFDVHFFTVSEAEQIAVTGGPDTASTNMNRKYFPFGFLPDNQAEPGMGLHFMDSTLSKTKTFGTTMMYGFYHGNYYFIEPMFAASYFNKMSGVVEYQGPQYYKKSGYYTNGYSIIFDSSQYSIGIGGLRLH